MAKIWYLCFHRTLSELPRLAKYGWHMADFTFRKERSEAKEACAKHLSPLHVSEELVDSQCPVPSGGPTKVA